MTYQICSRACAKLLAPLIGKENKTIKVQIMIISFENMGL